jgi:hypothetical protein
MQYKALSPIKYNEGTIQPGEELDLSEEEASELLQIGAIELSHKPFAAGKMSLAINH